MSGGALLVGVTRDQEAQSDRRVRVRARLELLGAGEGRKNADRDDHGNGDTEHDRRSRLSPDYSRIVVAKATSVRQLGPRGGPNDAGIVRHYVEE